MVVGLVIGGLVIIAAGGYFGLKLATKVKPAANNAAVQKSPKNIRISIMLFLDGTIPQQAQNITG